MREDPDRSGQAERKRDLRALIDIRQQAGLDGFALPVHARL